MKNTRTLHPKIPNMEPKCECLILDPYEICSFCRKVKYLLNFKALKFCLKGVPESVQDHIVTPFLYFKRIHGCHPFFAWSRDLSRIEIYLDNPHEPYNIKKLINFFCK